MNHTYSTTDSEIDVGGNDVEELLIKIQKLTTENESLGKSLREKDHVINQKSTENQMEIEKLKRSNENLEGLLNAYKAQPQITATVTPSQQGSIEELENKIAELENKLFLVEQNEHNTKRQNQTLNMEITNLKLEIDKLSINMKSFPSSVSVLKKDDNKELEGDENIDDKTKTRLIELIKENEELVDVRESLLNMVTEKEMESAELREQLDGIKEEHTNEMNQLIAQMEELKNKLDDKDYGRGNDGDNDAKSFNTEEAKALQEMYSDLQTEFDDFKREVEEKEKQINYQQEKFKKEFESSQYLSRTTISELENENTRLRNEIANLENEKIQWGKHENDSDSKNYLIVEIENYQAQIRQLEEAKEKSEIRLKEQISQLNSELKEVDQMYQHMRDSKNEVEKELNHLKGNSNKNLKEAQEKSKAELDMKTKEIARLKERIETIDKEKETYRKDFDILKKSGDKTKNDYKELNETLKKIRETNEAEMRKWEERYYGLEKKMEGEKISLIEQNKELLFKLGKLKEGYHRMSVAKRPNETTVLNTLSDVLDDEEEDENNIHSNNDSNNNQIILLKEEINLLKNKIADLNSKLNQSDKQKNELDILRVENLKVKTDVKEMKEMYETQIQELQQKAIQISNELTSSKRRTTSLRAEYGLSTKQLQMLNDLETTITKLNAEHKFLTEKCDILSREIELLKQLRDNDVKFLKDELKYAEEQAINAKVGLATLAFEKDSELIRLKNMYKKLRMKLQSGMNNQPVPSTLTKSQTTKK
jgi:chromosome segregation ATPase